jgi:predicted 3-demethylubiquinone-9 3-methyltransferase (glyoxalase superfamily)
MPLITPSLLFSDQCLEAAQFYVSIFPNSRITNVSYYGENAPMPSGTPLDVEFDLDGQAFSAINAGAPFAFNESVSFRVNCADQGEVDRYWDALSAGGEEGRCGWLTDRFGVAWQVVPIELARFLGDPDPVRAQRAMTAMLSMSKLDLAMFKAAVDAD